MTFGDLALSDHGGATIAVIDAPADITGARWQLNVTPKGGTPIVFYAAETGSLIAHDVQTGLAIDRTATSASKDIEGCGIDSATSDTITGKTGKPIELATSTLSEFKFLETMTPADTAIDQPPPMP